MIHAVFIWIPKAGAGSALRELGAAWYDPQPQPGEPAMGFAPAPQMASSSDAQEWVLRVATALGREMRPLDVLSHYVQAANGITMDASGIEEYDSMDAVLARLAVGLAKR